MCRQRHQPAIPPHLPLSQALPGQPLAALGLDGCHDLAGPVDPAQHLREDVGIDALVALDIIAHATGRIEVNGLERSHERPAQRQPVADADIDILDTGVAVGDKPESLLQQGALQAVHDEAVELALHHQRRMAGIDEEGARPFQRLGGRPRRRHHLGRRNEIGRVDRMHDQAAVPPLQMVGEFRRQQRRGGTGDDRLRAGKRIDQGKHLALHIEVFRRVLLDMGCIGQRLRQFGDDGDAAEHGFDGLPAHQVVRGKIAEHAFYVVAGATRRGRRLVPHPHIMACAGEADRPGPPDEPASDNRDIGHGSFLRVFRRCRRRRATGPKC